MLILEEQGLGAGLNKRSRKNNGEGTKVGRFFRKNVRARNINIKNAVAFGTIAASFIPAGKVAGIGAKLVKAGKIGKLATKAIALSQTAVGAFVLDKVKQGLPLNRNEQQVVTNIAVAQDQDATTPNVLSPEEFNAVAPNAVQADAPQMPSVPTPAQIKTIAQVKGVSPESIANASTGDAVPNDAQVEAIANLKGIPAEDLKEEANNLKDAPGTSPVKKGNKTLLIGGGIAALLLVGFVATRK